MSTFPIVSNVTIVPVLDTNIYASGDILFIEHIVAQAARRSGAGTATLVSISGYDLTNTTGVAFEVWFFDSEPTGAVYAVNDPFGMADTDAPRFVGYATVAADDYAGAANSCVFTTRNVGLQMLTATVDDLWVIGVTRGAPTMGAVDDIGINRGFHLGIAMSYTGSVRLVDENGASYGIKQVGNKPRVSSMPYLYDIAEGNVSGHAPFIKIGYNAAVITNEEEVWSAGGSYVFPTAEMGMEIVSADNTQDIGTVIKGDSTGNTVQADADGTTTLLEDDSVDFTAATAVAVGDCVILDPHGTTPEWGYVTGVVANTLTVAGGFSDGGTAASRYYAVVDKSAYTHGQVIAIHYLDADYVSKEEIVVLNGTTAVPTINTDLFRINYMHVIAAGSVHAPLGDIDLRHLTDTPTYAHITALFTRERGAIFTVPAGITAYITSFYVAAANPNDTKVQTARVIVSANSDPYHDFMTGDIFYPYIDTVVTNGQSWLEFSLPIPILEKTDFKVSTQGFTGFAGPVSCVIRGWVE